jgi:hydrogenase maturation protease
VVGIGNLLLSDDGVGIHAIRILRTGHLASMARLIDGGTIGTDLLAEVCGCERLLVIDAVDAGLRAGAIIRLDLSAPDAQRVETRNAHQWGISGLLDDLRLMGQGPRETVLIGVQLATTNFGTQLSSEVAGALSALAGAVARQLEEWRAGMVDTGCEGHQEKLPDAAHASAAHGISGTEKVTEYI